MIAPLSPPVLATTVTSPPEESIVIPPATVTPAVPVIPIAPPAPPSPASFAPPVDVRLPLISRTPVVSSVIDPPSKLPAAPLVSTDVKLRPSGSLVMDTLPPFAAIPDVSTIIPPSKSVESSVMS